MVKSSSLKIIPCFGHTNTIFQGEKKWDLNKGGIDQQGTDPCNHWGSDLVICISIHTPFTYEALPLTIDLSECITPANS